MDVEFRTDVLARLESDPSARTDLPPEVVRAYRKRIHSIRAAHDERDLYAIKSNRFKKLAGDRAHQRSMRLNDQWRLVLELRATVAGTSVFVCAIEDYH